MFSRAGPRLIVHSRCRVLRKGYQGRYQYRRLKIAGSEERYIDEPDKNAYSHPHDANQYVAARLFGDAMTQTRENKPIETWRDRLRKRQARRTSAQAA